MNANLETIVDRYARMTVPGGFHMDEEWYAGRRPSSSDISTETLEGIYKGLQEEVGQKAATNFVIFVHVLRDMSASPFIAALRRFWENDCMEIIIQPKNEDHVGNEAGAFAELVAAWTGNKATPAEIASGSRMVKRQFLANHENEIPEKIRKMH